LAWLLGDVWQAGAARRQHRPDDPAGFGAWGCREGRLLCSVPSVLGEAMKNLALKVQRFLVSEDGPTAVEYAVMLALIIVVCLTAIQAVGTNAASTFNTVSGKIGGTTAS
jgi:pilus assembly protein Flp/PilA